MVALFLAAFTIVILAATARDVGVTWDEPIYMEASESYVSWLGELVTRPKNSLGSPAIQEFWGLNHEHPPFDKVWSGLIWTGARNLFDDLTAHRLGNIILSGALVGLLYLMVGQAYGRVAGLAAAGALLTTPRFFFHAHLAALDVPSTVTIFVVTFLFWRTLDLSDLKWSLWLGIAYGIALATKINALAELPVLLGVWAFLFRRELYVFIRLGVMGLTGVLVWLLLWPWFYHDTWHRLVGYLDFMTIHHYGIDEYYHGRLFSSAPWHFPFVMTLMVVPLTLTVLAAIGSVRVMVGGRNHALGWLFVLGALVPLLIFATGKAKIFDNERLLMPSFPYIAALSGVGFSQLILGMRRVAQRWCQEKWVSLPMCILVVIVFVPHVAVAYRLYPHFLSYYSETVCGLPGAERLRMETTYWAETYDEALPYLNAHAPPQGMVWVEAHDVMLYYQKHGALRRDLRIASPSGKEAIVTGARGYQAAIEDADLAVIEYRESGLSKQVTDWLRNRNPVYVLSRDHIPLLGIYNR